jgi:hypothetical protein
MKNICIKEITMPCKSSPYIKHRLYNVYLGNGYRFECKSLASAKAFINQTNKFLNYKLHEINSIVAALQGEYRNVWFYLDGRFENEARINEAFSNCDTKINMAINRADFTNGNHYVFIHLNFAINELIAISKIIAKLQYKKSNMPDYYRLIVIHNRLSAMIEEIKNYPTLT